MELPHRLQLQSRIIVEIKNAIGGFTTVAKVVPGRQDKKPPNDCKNDCDASNNADLGSRVFDCFDEKDEQELQNDNASAC